MTGKPGSFSGRLFGQTSDSRIGFWLRRLLALIAGNLVVHFLPVSVIFWGARPRRQIPRRTEREALDIRGEHGIVGSVALAAPIFLFLPLPRRAGRVLHLEPFA